MLKARKVVGEALFGVTKREANTGTLRTLKLAICKVGGCIDGKLIGQMQLSLLRWQQ